MKVLNVKITDRTEVAGNWGNLPIFKTKMLFIQCNSEGVVKWHSASLYTLEEVLKRGNVIIK
jgi:hypothetical protein